VKPKPNFAGGLGCISTYDGGSTVVVVVGAALGRSTDAVELAGRLGSPGARAGAGADDAGGAAGDGLEATRGCGAGTSAIVDVCWLACGSRGTIVVVVVAVVVVEVVLVVVLLGETEAALVGGGGGSGAATVGGVVEFGTAKGDDEPVDAELDDEDGDVDPSEGGVSRTSGGREESDGEVTVVSEVVESEVVVEPEVVVDCDVVASTTGTGSHVNGDDGSTGNGSPGASVAAGSCSTTL
jgi:hypothetical protein